MVQMPGPSWVHENVNVWRFYRTETALEADFNGHFLIKQIFDDCPELSSRWKNINRWYLEIPSQRQKQKGLSWRETDIGKFLVKTRLGSYSIIYFISC